MNFIKILFLSLICALKSYSFHNVEQSQLKILDSGDATTLTSKSFTNCIAVIVFNKQNKERILLHRSPSDPYFGYKNFDLLSIFIDKSDVSNLEAFIVTLDENVTFFSDISSLFAKKGLSCHIIRVDYFFNISLSAEGIIKITKSNDSSLIKKITINTSNYEEKKESVTDAVQEDFKNKQLANLEKIKNQVNNNDNLINKRIFNSDSLLYLIENKMMECSSGIGGYGIAKFTYFDVLHHEFVIESKNEKYIPYYIEKMFLDCGTKILKNIVLSDAETKLKHYLASTPTDYIEKLFISFKNYENLISDIVKSLPLSLEQFNILENHTIHASILENKLDIKDALLLTKEQIQIFKEDNIFRLITIKKLDIKDALLITKEQIQIIKENNILRLIVAGTLDIKDALLITKEQIQIIKEDNIFRLIAIKKLDIKDALFMNSQQLEILKKDDIFRLIATNELDIKDALLVTPQIN